VIRTDVFGTTGSNSSAYNKGRTATHEIGHWLNLKHLWGDRDCGDDNVDDTPQQKTYSSGCSSFPKITAGSCNTNPAGDMFMNFMDFSDDACIVMFTNGQKNRMRDLFSEEGARAAMLQSPGLNKPTSITPKDPSSQTISVISVYPNPSSDEIKFRNHTGATVTPDVYALYDTRGKLLMSGYTRSTLAINRLMPGIYFVKVQIGATQKVLRFVKQ